MTPDASRRDRDERGTGAGREEGHVDANAVCLRVCTGAEAGETDSGETGWVRGLR
jgi:hypothetical protein